MRFTGPVPWAELPAHYGAGDVFAMPCRTRRGGLDVEGLGIVYLEASATGLPVVAGDSGGAPDAVLDGETGWVVRGGEPGDAAERINALLGDAELRRRMGERGRAWVEEKWRWDLLAERLRELLDTRTRGPAPHRCGPLVRVCLTSGRSTPPRPRSPSPPRSASASARA